MDEIGWACGDRLHIINGFLFALGFERAGSSLTPVVLTTVGDPRGDFDLVGVRDGSDGPVTLRSARLPLTLNGRGIENF